MPKPTKKKPKQKTKAKVRVEPEAPSITTKRSYWLGVSAILALMSAILAISMGLDATRIAILVVTILAPVGVWGYIRVTPSKMSISKRATFLFIGLSVIGFGIWATIVLVGGVYGLTAQLMNTLGGQFFITTSLVICLSAGAFIGELIGGNKAVQERLFNPLDEK
jgi:FtsH-binding integral membrane protein